MSALLILSMILISSACIFYSVGVWAEKLARYLKPWHVTFFWTGFIFDITATLTMHIIAKGHFNILSLHTLTGQIAIWLMFGHAIWATCVSKKGSESKRAGFHKYSLIVWIIWLIPYIGGMYIGFTK